MHAASEYFVEAELKKEDFDKREKEIFFNRLHTVPEYEYIPRVKAMMEKEGCKQVFQRISTNYNLVKQ